MMVEVVIDSIRVSLMSPQRIIILREMNSERFLPIWIGPFEAEAITSSLQEIEVIRPMTHDLLRKVLNVLGGQVLRINITELRDDVFYARIVVSANGQEIEIDSRPSDALALAVRTHVPIYVSEDVLEEAASIPETEVDDTGTAGEAEDRLKVYKDFIETLDLDEIDNSEEDAKE
jgi:hypothetical protein